MEYENGKEYTFKFGNVTVEATFERLTPEVVQRFNRICAEEKARAYFAREAENNDRKRAYAGAC